MAGFDRIRNSLTQYRIFSAHRQNLAPRNRLRWLGISSLWVYRVLTWSVLAAGLAFAGVVLGLRHWILPNIESYRGDIARIISETARKKVTIGSIHANWDGLRPQLMLGQVTVFDAAGRPALELTRIDTTVSWLSLATLELRFHAVDIYRPTLNVRRDARGVLSVAGIETTAQEGGGGFADWLLRQRDVEVHDAAIVWNDELRAAPQIEFKSVFFHLFNRGSRHRFGLRATPPSNLAAPFDLRGDIRGRTVTALDGWNGRLYVQLDYADIAAWRIWIPFPIEFPQGAGALRAWLTFSQDRLVEAIADVRLANIRTRLAKELPELDLAELAGRVGWKQSDTGFELTTSQLAFATTGGLKLQPVDFLLRYATDGAGKPLQGEMRASAFELEPLVLLAGYLPLSEEARKHLAEYSPRGVLSDTMVRWNGEWSAPRQYSIRGRFQNVSLNPVGRIPGLTGVSGSLEANERAGTASLNSRNATVEMPLVFRDQHAFDTLAAQVTWTRSGDDAEVRLNNVAFSNAHLAGTVLGVYRTAGSARGSIDLTGNLTRAQAHFVGRYIPLVVGKATQDWLDAAFLAGGGNSVTLRLKGNLDKFPFADGRDGVFQVTAKVTGVRLHYAEGWPDIENITGDLVFRGARMDVYARQGSIFGVRLPRVHVEIPDLLHGNKMLNVSGDAEGPTADFLAFIDKSPVAGMINEFTAGWQAQGSGKLALKLSLPLSAPAFGNTSVAGTYQFAANTIVIAPDFPAVEQAGGRIEFTESTVRVPGVNGTLLGGPVAISATSAGGAAVRVNVQGRLNADSARRSAGDPVWAQRLRGATDWRAQITARKRTADILVESSLQGLAVDLPAPLAKSAAETLPVRFERRLLSSGQDRLSLSVGEVLSMDLLRRTEGDRVTIPRGTVRFGGAAAEPERPGVWVSGAVKALDIDRWLALFPQDGGETRVEWGGVDLRLGALDVLGRRFNELTLNAAVQDGHWRGTVYGKEVEGSASWQPQGRGRLVARLKSLTVPAASPAAFEVPGAARREQKESELPAIDVIAEQFINKDKPLGRLEFVATPEGRNWRIEKLSLVNPESTFTLDGLWQVGPAQPRTQINLRLEAADVGKLLVRLGYPEGVQRGSAKLDGTASWSGAPYDVDYPTLSGTLSLEAAKGQFVKLDPGVAKLLGILSLQALPRRATLDFRDVFSEGFAFDEIAGTATITHGVATTESFRIQGPAARVTMSGEVDLAQETQKLRVRIVPQVTETVAIAGAILGGPIAGVAAYVAQKVLKDPFGQAVAFEYDVAGTWSEPTVKRVPRAVPEATVWPD
jgi:uncharacterized protein (TIGR02099 family)